VNAGNKNQMIHHEGTKDTKKRRNENSRSRAGLRGLTTVLLNQTGPAIGVRCATPETAAWISNPHVPFFFHDLLGFAVTCFSFFSS
jgi:hypothetical protein